MVLWAIGRVPIVKGHMKTVQVLLTTLRNVGDKLLGCFANLLGRNHDGRTVCVVGAYKVDLMALHALGADPNVSLDVLHDVANVKISIGIGQSGGDKQLAYRHGSLIFWGSGD